METLSDLCIGNPVIKTCQIHNQRGDIIGAVIRMISFILLESVFSCTDDAHSVDYWQGFLLLAQDYKV